MNYANYREHIEKLQYYKNQLVENLEKLKNVRRDYFKYLKENPYSGDKKILQDKVNGLRVKIIEMI